tara:strand:- start:473 stop:613 length:141 start_codon:yes stop_codon:yes gene_type:complete
VVGLARHQVTAQVEALAVAVTISTKQEEQVQQAKVLRAEMEELAAA